MKNLPQIILSNGILNNESVVFIDFEFAWDIVILLRNYYGTIYIPSEKRWYVLTQNFNLNEFFNRFKTIAFINYSNIKHKAIATEPAKKERFNTSKIKQQLTPETKSKIANFKVWMQQKRYGENTAKTYIHQLELFFGYYSHKTPEEIDNTDIVDFNYEFIVNNNLSSTFQNQTVSALKKFYTHHFNRNIDGGNIERPRKSNSLPKVIAKNDLQLIFKSIQNAKHKMALETI